MLEVKHDETMGVRLLARQPHTVSASAPGDVGGVDPDIGPSISIANQPLIAGSVLIDIVHVTMSRIITLCNVRTSTTTNEQRTV